MSGSEASNLGYGNIVPYSNVNSSYVNVNNSHYPGGFGSNQIPGLPGLAGAKFNVDAAAARVPGICMSGGKNLLRRKIKNITKRYKMSKKSMKKHISLIKDRVKSLTMSRTQNIAGGKGHKKSCKTSGGKNYKYSSMIAGKKRRRKGCKTRKGGNPLMLFRLGKYAKSKFSKKQDDNTANTDNTSNTDNTTSSNNTVPEQEKEQLGGYSQYQNNMPMTQTYSLGGHLSSTDLGLANPPPYKVLSNNTSCVDNYNHYTNVGFPSRGH
jgi:hypothetical protein